MKLAIIAVGIPGSGKTTMLSPLAEKYGLVRISRDDIRQELFGDPLDRSDQERVWREADEQLRQALNLGGSIILDSTFVEKEKRLQAVEDVRGAGADRVIGLVFTTPLELAEERNRARAHLVRDEVIDAAYENLESDPPTLHEGFDVLYTADQVEALEIELSSLEG